MSIIEKLNDWATKFNIPANAIQHAVVTSQEAILERRGIDTATRALDQLIDPELKMLVYDCAKDNAERIRDIHASRCEVSSNPIPQWNGLRGQSVDSRFMARC